MSEILNTIENDSSSAKSSTAAKPFLRWAGGKRWFIKDILELTKDLKFNKYHEPFLGGGSIFFALKPEKAFLSDLNSELIETYKVVKWAPKKLISHLNSYLNTEDEYYEIRKKQPQSVIEKAAQFIYLNNTSYNGIYRVNKNGIYNVPYGFKKNYSINETNILNVRSALKTATLTHGDFTCIEKNIAKNDLVFLDPPYTVSHDNNGFIAYNQRLFSLDDQKRLSNLIDFIKSEGAYYVLTNAAHDEIKKIFSKDDRLIELKRACTIGGLNAKREKVTEYIFTNVGKEEGGR